MFGRLFSIDLKETNDTYIVTGINGRDIGKFITNVWKTSVLEQHMFKSITGGRFGKMEFYKFFLIDVVYMLERLADRRNPRIPAKTLNDIISVLKENTWLKDVNNLENAVNKLDLNRLKLFNFNPLPHQSGFLEYYNKIPQAYQLSGALINAAPGAGKGIAYGTTVRIPNGWKKIEDLQLGDLVNTPNGDAAKVIGIYDHKNLKCYRVTFEDGRSCICDENHLWEVYNNQDSGSWKTIGMMDLLKEYNRQKEYRIQQGIPESMIRYRLHIPLVDPTHSADQDINLPLDPYLLGVLLGDGSIIGGVKISKPDIDIYDEVKKIVVGYECETNVLHTPNRCLTYSIIGKGYKDNEIQRILKHLGLYGKCSHEKFIPLIYLNSSFNQRLALIQGLMDTDGSVYSPSRGRGGKLSRMGSIEWATTSEQLAKGMCYLLRSVGCIVKMKERQTYFTYNGDKKPGKISYRLNIRSQIPSLLFRSRTKKDKCSDYNQYTIKGLKLRIKNIEEVPSVPTRCITVDHPDKLFVIKDFICTHNTFTAMCTQVTAGCDRIIVACPKNALIRVWYNDIQKMFKNPPKIWNSDMSTPPVGDETLFVYHYESLDKIMEHHGDHFGKYKYGFVLDECHNLNDAKSQRTQKWLHVVKASGSDNILHMSGTPFKAIGAESIPLFRAIDPFFTPVVEERFKKIYGTSAQKGLDILKNRLGLVSYIVKKEELDIGKPIMNTVGIKIPNGNDFTLTAVRAKMSEFIEERLRYYKSREKDDFEFYKWCLDIHRNKIINDRRAMVEYTKYLDYIKIIQSTTEYGSIPEQISFCKRYEFNVISASLPREHVKEFRSVCSIIKYLALKIQGECLGQVVGKMRVDAHVAMCKYIPFRDICQSTKKKTIVFTSFVEVLEEAMVECNRQELNPILVYGKTNNNLTKLIESFEKDKDVNPLIATYNSLSTAVPLVMADTMIMINAPFRAYIQEQAISRIHRLNQDSQTVIYQLYLDTGNEVNISSRSLDIMKWSQQQVEQITGVSSPYKLEDGEEGSFNVSTEDYFEGELDYHVKYNDTFSMEVKNINLPKTIIELPTKRTW